MEVSEAIGFAYDGHTWLIVARAVAWLMVVVACAIAVRRPWAWLGLAGGLLALTSAGVVLADHLAIRADVSEPSAQVFDGDYDYPGFLDDREGLADLMDLSEAVGVALVAVAFAVSAFLSRRRATPAAD